MSGRELAKEWIRQTLVRQVDVVILPTERVEDEENDNRDQIIKFHAEYRNLTSKLMQLLGVLNLDYERQVVAEVLRGVTTAIENGEKMSREAQSWIAVAMSLLPDCIPDDVDGRDTRSPERRMSPPVSVEMLGWAVCPDLGSRDSHHRYGKAVLEKIPHEEVKVGRTTKHRIDLTCFVDEYGSDAEGRLLSEAKPKPRKRAR